MKMNNEDLCRLAKNGDEEAKNQLFKQNQGIVHHIANGFRNTQYDIEELVSLGNLGMMKGYEKFNIESGNKFMTYIVPSIRNEILMYIRSNKKHPRFIPLDKQIDIESNPTELHEIIVDNSDDEFDKIIEFEAARDIYEKVANQLDEKRKFILDSLINGTYNQRVIGKELGLSQSYVSRLKEKVIKIIEINTKASGLERVGSKKYKVKRKRGDEMKINKEKLQYILTNYEGIRNKTLSEFFKVTGPAMHSMVKKFNDGEFKKWNIKTDDSVKEEFEEFLSKTSEPSISSPVKVYKIDDLPEDERKKYMPKKVEEKPIEKEIERQDDPVIEERKVEVIELDHKLNEQLNVDYYGDAEFIKNLIQMYTSQIVNKLNGKKELGVKFIIEVYEN